jgi:hypothetical protein
LSVLRARALASALHDLAAMITQHLLEPDDAAVMTCLRVATRATKGLARGIEARQPFDALMENVRPHEGVVVNADTIGQGLRPS